MKIKHLFTIACFMTSLVASAQNASTISLTVNAGDLRPMSFRDSEGKPAGIAVEILKEASKRSGMNFDIQVYPWPRAQENAKSATTPEGIVPLSRTKEREKDYYWVSKLYEQKMVFVTLKEPPNTVEAAKALKIGTLNGNPYAKQLAEMGFNKVELVATEDQNAKKLQAGRIDAWLVSDVIAKTVFSDSVGGATPIKYGATLGEPLQVFLGGTKNFSPDVAKKIDAIIRKMQADGVIDEILKKYR